jgi:hypothetical protein
MPDRFQHYFPLTEEQRNHVWFEGTIILDANVFLQLYRLPKQEREEFLMVLKHEQIASRLWVPHQVAEEVFRNRANVIEEQTKLPEGVLAEAEKSFKGIIQKINDSIRKHHPFVRREEWKKKIETFLPLLNDDYQAAKDTYCVSVDSDPFLSDIQYIMRDRIGEGFSDEELKTVIAEGKRRIDNKRPPGYKDAGKSGNRDCGDYIIWAQVLKEMAKRKQPVVLVSGEQKEDWWLKRHGQCVGPRLELRQEYTRETGEEFILVTTQRFLEWASRIVDLEHLIAIQEAIEESRRFDSPQPSPFKRRISGRITPEEMAEWFLENYASSAEFVGEFWLGERAEVVI